MEFIGKLCLALGRTLSEVSEMSAAEFAFWTEFHARHGFPFDRLEASVAIAGAAQLRAWGSKIEPRDLLPRLRSAQKIGNAVLAARLSTLRGAKVVRIPHEK